LFIGIFCGYFGGLLDILVQRLVDVVISVPNLLFAIMFVTILGPGFLTLIVVLGLRTGIVGSRVIRGAVIALRENMYIQAAESIGCSALRIFVRHILPNIMAPTLILFSTRVPVMILTEASLSFLGFGIPPPFPSWGSMLSGTGRNYFEVAPWMAIYPGLALALVVYGVNMLGDAVRDLLDPRLRGGVGRYGMQAENIKPLTKGADGR
jgi:peptide/nickel transport system permease protein